MSQARSLEPLLPSPSAQDLSQKCISAINGSLTCLCIALGHNLGLYAALKRLGPTSSQDLATAVDLSERWVREWLYQQAAAELISTDKQAQSFWMTEAQADLLVEAPSLEEAKESPLGKPLQESCGSYSEDLQVNDVGRGMVVIMLKAILVHT